ncbi:MAG: ABC transporter ATP-binding protein [Tissierellales bacterium]|jgi:zinc transport system ATP-binding protein|nr:ABC transporter ATP-binding protein [Tissierellales bacterium]
MYAVEIKNLTHYYGDVCALKDVDLKVKELDFLGIIGPNGGGKTTLMKAVLGQIKPQSGEIIMSTDKPVGYVPQFSAFDKQFPIRVIDVVLMGRLSSKLKLFHKYNSEDVKKAKGILEHLGMRDFAKRQIGQLSGGQLQKVLIARALMTDPDLLLLDEPTASLDKKATIEIYELLRKLNETKTIIIISHDMEELFSYVQSVAYINQTIHYHREDLAENIGKIGKIFDCPIDLLLNSYKQHNLKGHEVSI